MTMWIGVALVAASLVILGGLMIVALRQRNVDKKQTLTPQQRLELARSIQRHPAGRAFSHLGIHADRYREREEAQRMIEHSMKDNEHGEPVLTITVTGGREIFRLSYHLMQGQIEFGELAREVFVALRRRWGIRSFRAIDKTMTGGRVEKLRWHMPAERD